MKFNSTYDIFSMVISMFFHGVINGLVDQKILQILKDGKIKSAAKRNNINNRGFNEMDYISVCEYLGEDIYKDNPNNAFHKYILDNFCFIISDIDVEMPIFIKDGATMNRFELIKLKNNNPDKRYSDIIDERQVKDEISLSKVIAIGIPYHPTMVDGYIKLSSFTFMTPKEYQEFVHKIESYAQGLGITIVDSSNPHFVETISNKKIKQ